MYKNKRIGFIIAPFPKKGVNFLKKQNIIDNSNSKYLIMSLRQEAFYLKNNIEVIVLKYDHDKNRVSLGMKQLQEDPWEEVSKNLELNKHYKGKVINIVDYGVFIDLNNNIEGLVRTSELDWTNKNINPNKVVNIGDEIDVAVIEIDNEKVRVIIKVIKLKVKLNL